MAFKPLNMFVEVLHRALGNAKVDDDLSETLLERFSLVHWSASTDVKSSS